MSSDDEEDIFCYTPLYRSRTQSSSQLRERKPSRLSLSQRKNSVNHLRVSSKACENKLTSSSHNVKANTSCATATIGKRKSVESGLPENDHKTAELDKLDSDVCPSCMMPWKEYDRTGKSRVFHTDECLDLDFSIKEECKDGIECCSISESHFWNSTHKTLAELHSQHVGALTHNLSQSKKQDQNKKKKLHSPSEDSGYEDVAVAGPSKLRESTFNSSGKNKKSCSINSQSELNDGHVNLDLDNSIPLFILDSDDTSDDSTEIFSAKELLQNKHSSDVSSSSNEFSKPKHFNSISKHSSPSKVCKGNDSVNFWKMQKSQILIWGLYSKLLSTILKMMRTLQPDYKENETNVSNNDEYSDTTRCSLEDLPTTLHQNDNINTVTTEIHNLKKLECNIDNATRSDVQSKENAELSHLRKQVDDNDVDSEIFDDNIFAQLVDMAVEKYFDKNKNDMPCCDSAEKKNQSSNSNKECPGQPSCQPCIHLHFHLNEIPEKLPVKGSVKHYRYCISLAVSLSRWLICVTLYFIFFTACKKCKTSQKPAAESWKPLMQKMQRKLRLPSVSDSSESSRNPKEVNFGTQQSDQNKKTAWQQRKCPFYKYIPETNIVVDAFCYGYLDGVSAYFLTHFHYDHYRGLKKSFNRPIYCSEITAKLVNLRLGVANQFIFPLPMEESVVVCGLEVTLLEANHCPGAVMFLFKLRTGATVLHVGDFRAHPKMESYPALWNCSIDTLYLDTTYCNPVYSFPSQEDVLEKCVSIATTHVNDNSKTLIVVGSYSIGKERVFRAIAMSLNCRIWASNDKQKILRCIPDEEIQARLTSDKFSAQVHVMPMNDLKPKKLMDYIETMKPRYTAGVAIRPTGWEYSDNDEDLVNLSPKQHGNVYMYGIPYSEHSSYAELKRFVQFIHPKKIIPTVNVGNSNTRKMMEKDFSEWLRKPRGSSVERLW
nr:DNA cross-link repair 1A protein-like [Cherax quadricarinatus]